MSEDVRLQRISDIRAGIMLDLNDGKYTASLVADGEVTHTECDTVFEAQNWIGNRIHKHFESNNLLEAVTKDIEEVEKWKQENRR